jgi:hypothetical protein
LINKIPSNHSSLKIPLFNALKNHQDQSIKDYINNQLKEANLNNPFSKAYKKPITLTSNLKSHQQPTPEKPHRNQ